MHVYAIITRHPPHVKHAGVLSGLIHAGVSTLGGHVGTNALGLAAHHKSNIQEVLAHRGLQHGLLEQKISPVALQSIKSVFGPESMIAYEAAHRAGIEAVGTAPHPQVREMLLKGLTRYRAKDTVPILPAVQQAMHHELHGTTPSLQAEGRAATLYGKVLDHFTSTPVTGMETGAQRALKHIHGAAPIAALTAVDTALSTGVPVGALGHVAWNGARQAGAHTDIGHKMIADELVKGARGEMPNKTQEWLFNHLASPAFLDARRLAAQAPRIIGAATKLAPVENLARRGIHAGLGAPAVRTMHHAAPVYQAVKQLQAPPAPPPTWGERLHTFLTRPQITPT